MTTHVVDPSNAGEAPPGSRPTDAIAARALGPAATPWPTDDPFLFCVHHDDAYPAGNDRLGPAASLAGRELGMDFTPRDGWRMYHGREVPGFPQHPHRGFETVTVVRRGHVDHSDSLGATARYGEGDVQWLTAGAGIVHCEMFPLLNNAGPNPAELFQIWLNLPKASKFATPHFSMLWAPTVPRRTHLDTAGNETEIVVVAGTILGRDVPVPAPPPDSWASRAESHVAIATFRLAANATYTLPAAEPGLNRTLYFFQGGSLMVGGELFDRHAAIRTRSELPVVLTAGAEPVEVLLLQGRPIAEPVFQHGPFVMNSREEIVQAFEDYRRTQFGGWPWPVDGPVHAREAGRFASVRRVVTRPPG